MGKKDLRLSGEHKKEMLRMMWTIRHFELKIQEYFLAGDIPGFAHIYVGEEATAVGVSFALNKDDYVVSTHRGHGHCIAKGGDINRLMAELYGRVTGYSSGRGGSMHIFALDIGFLGTSGIVGGGLPLSIGAGLHARLRKTEQVSVCFFGDGASNQGTFHESINLAATWHLPVIFICENNLYATGTAFSDVSLIKDIAERAKGYGIPGVAVDGNDVLKVYEATSEAVDRARRGKGPTLIESKTYRHYGHYIGEPGTGYRRQEEIDEWKDRDPIKLFSDYLVRNRIMDREGILKIEKEVKDIVERAQGYAASCAFPEPETALDNVFA